ncbi:MAG TPA: M23 family metallopeptidase [Patescibacteria group bacterium]|nr:M23 family metallopeptidase [Patescibacteria group bacterium]
MKFNDLFSNRRNIYFVSLIIIALLLAGGVWQYNNYISGKMAELDFENQLDELDKLLEEQDDLGVKIIEDTSAEGGTEEPIKEVSNTDNNAKEKTPPVVPKTPTAGKSNEKPIAAVKIEPVDIDTMILPVFGNISIDYSDTELAYSKTIDSWITHSGLDLKAEEGSPVRAALDGVVLETTNDAQWGLTIVLDHGDGVYTRYSNLSTLDLVSKGQQLKKGDVISGVGKTALCEIAEEPHLHFELIRDKQNIDPKNYLPKKLK